MKGSRLNDRERKLWVENDFRLYNHWKASGLSLGQFVKVEQRFIDQHIRAELGAGSTHRTFSREAPARKPSHHKKKSPKVLYYRDVPFHITATPAGYCVTIAGERYPQCERSRQVAKQKAFRVIDAMKGD